MTAHERGSTTVAAMSVVALLVMVFGVFAVMADLSSAAQRAGRAADAAALAASSASVLGQDACTAARSVALENDAEIVTCRMDADVATITVRSASNSPWGRWGAEREARAAPLSYLE